MIEMIKDNVKKSHDPKVREILRSHLCLDPHIMRRILQNIFPEVEKDFGMIGFSEGKWFDFLSEVIKRYCDRTMDAISDVDLLPLLAEPEKLEQDIRELNNQLFLGAKELSAAHGEIEKLQRQLLKLAPEQISPELKARLEPPQTKKKSKVSTFLRNLAK